MRRSSTGVLASLLLLAACQAPVPPDRTGASPSAAPGPAATPAAATPATGQSGSPTPAPPSPSGPSEPQPPYPPMPTASGWPVAATTPSLPVPVLGADGTAYVDVSAWTGWPAFEVADARVEALDASGSMRPGWPVSLGGGWVAGLVVAGDGSIMVTTHGGTTNQGRDVAARLYRLGPDGRVAPGWPVSIDGSWRCPSTLAAPGGTTYVVCYTPSTNGDGLVDAYRPDGTRVPGWPVPIERLSDPVSAAIGPDGTFYLRAQSAMGGGLLEAIAADGARRPGWPVSVPRISSFAMANDGTLRVVGLTGLQGGACLGAMGSVVTAIGRDGGTMAGWPRSVPGVAVGPVVAPNGTVYVAAALTRAGQSHQVTAYAFDRTGRAKAGWPVAVPAVATACPTEAITIASGPAGGIVLLANTPTGQVVVLDARGRVPSGWPYCATAIDIGCTACTPGRAPMTPAFGRDGTIYLATARPGVGPTGVVALDGHGRVRAGWPQALPRPQGADLRVSLTVDPGGRLYVGTLATPADAAATGDPTGGTTTLLVLTGDGTAAR
jgi:hypothetical protein